MTTAIDEDDTTTWTLYELPHTPPEESELEAIAHRILGYKDDTQLRILYAVGDGPKRFKDLQMATEKPDGQLTRALSSLHEEGLLVERVNAREKPAVKTHDLSPRGAIVLDLIHRLHEVAQSEPFEVTTGETTYVLYTRLIRAEDGSRQRVYFFASKEDEPEDAEPAPAPTRGRVVIGDDGRPHIAQA